MAGEDRRLGAIMFTDIVGYTRMAQADEALALELLEEHRRLVRPLFSGRGGTEVKTIGDAFLVEFKSALEAVLCAVDIQKRIAARNASAPEPRRLALRIGIHVGDVVHSAGDVYGDAVNVASRIEPLAEPGGVCISQQVYDSVRTRAGLDFAKMGEIELKNVELPVGVYKVGLGEEVPAQVNVAPRERLAVLPFVNISPDPNDEYFVDGLTEEMITRLSEIKGLKVIARTSVMNYKKKEKNVSQIGRELGVGSIIEGSVRKSGNKIRVTVQLVDSGTQEHLWASNYDKQLDDIFEIQTDVASRVAQSLSTGVFAGSAGGEIDDMEAYTAYLRATQLLHEENEGSLREAVSLFEKATSKVPSFSRAQAGLAHAWCELVYLGNEEFVTGASKAEAAARLALDSGPERAESHAAMAVVHSMLDRYQESAREAERALQINPNLAQAYLSLGITYTIMGSLDRALGAFQKALELDPLSRGPANFTAYLLTLTGKTDQALEILEGQRAASPSNPRKYLALAEYYIMRGNYTKAQEYIDRAHALAPRENLDREAQGIVYALTGRREDAERIVAEVRKEPVESSMLYQSLFIRAALGDLDGAFDDLMRAAELHSWPFVVGSYPLFDKLRSDPRYEKFKAKVGLPP